MQNQSNDWDLQAVQSQHQWALILCDPPRWPSVKRGTNGKRNRARTEDSLNIFKGRMDIM